MAYKSCIVAIAAFLGGCVRVYACDDDDDDDDNFFVKLILGENKYREYQGEYRVVPE